MIITAGHCDRDGEAARLRLVPQPQAGSGAARRRRAAAAAAPHQMTLMTLMIMMMNDDDTMTGPYRVPGLGRLGDAGLNLKISRVPAREKNHDP